jgi:hypothetical protein
MRVRSHWFRPGVERTSEEIAGAAAFITFRIAQNSLKHMRTVGYDLPAGPAYFAFLAEFLAFLVHCADRIAHARGDEAWRVAFTTAMANKVGGYFAGNEAELLGADNEDACKRRFIGLVNARADDYASFGWSDDGPEYGFVRCFGHCVAETMSALDQSWAVSQVIECEAPEAVETLRRAIASLLDPSERPRRRAEAGASGE